MKFLQCACCIIAILLSCTFSGFAQIPQHATNVVEATGTGTIFSGDVAGARDRAIDDGLRRAVENALGTYIESEVRVENYMVVEDNIMSWSRGYVKNYSILSEKKKTSEMYEVHVQAEVETGELHKDAEAVKNLIEQMGNPRVMIMIDEQNIGMSRDEYHWFEVDMTASETAIMQKFIDKNFPVVDPATVRRNIERDQALAALEGDSKAAAAIGLSLGAEIVVTGKVIAKVATGMQLAGMKSCQANITARVVEADVGRVITTGHEHAAHPHIDEVTGGTIAIGKASDKLADQMITKILDKWKDNFYNQNEIKVVLTGVKSLTELNQFESTIKYYLRGVKNIFRRNFVSETAEMDIKLTGTAGQIAREFERRDFDKFTIKVTSVTANKIGAHLILNEATTSTEQDTL